MSGRLGASFATVLSRELERLAREIEAYPDEGDLWRVAGTVRNSPGTLALHVVGNLHCYVGAHLGDTGYVRDRDAEFGDRDVGREEVLERIRGCVDMVRASLDPLDAEALARPYEGPLPLRMQGISAAEFLIHLTWHLGWHVGQVDYHRRILVGGEPV